MAKLPLASRESVPENQRAAFDELLRGYGSVPRYGPGSVMINVPNAHQLMNAVNKYLRSESSLPKKIQPPRWSAVRETLASAWLPIPPANPF